MGRAVAIVAALVIIAAALVFILRHVPAASVPATPSSPTASATFDLAVKKAKPAPARDGGTRSATVLTAAWGSGAGQLGRRADAESVTEGPMSFLPTANGFVILDNVNQRLARFDAHGKPLPAIALPSAAAQDVARGPRDSLAVLDRLREKSLTLFAADGKQLLAVPLVGGGIEEPGGVTGVFSDGKGDDYIENAHASWLRLVDAAGNADAARTPAPGRPTRDGRFVNAAIADRNAGTARVQLFDAGGQAAWAVDVGFGAPIMYIALLDSDAAGDLFIAAHTGHEATTAPFKIEDETLCAIALSPSGDELGRLTLPAPPPAEEAFRDLAVGDDGTLYWMRRTPAGVQLESYRLF
jgi:hypothetical protein